MSKKKHYYVVVDGKVVYKKDNAKKLAYWATPTAMPEGEKPLDMIKSEAESLCECLILNFFNAHIEVYYWEMPYETESSGSFYQSKEPDCYCTNKVPVTDCEGCNFVLTCTNTYGLARVKA